MSPPRAIIFDFNGVIVDDEPIHMKAFQQVLAEDGHTLTEADYFGPYVGLNDRDFVARFFSDRGRELSRSEIAGWVTRKARAYRLLILKNIELFNGAESFIRRAEQRMPLAIVSGALRSEIDLILEHCGLDDSFTAIVAAEDVSEGKPSPEGYLLALQFLQGCVKNLEAKDCLVFEDSPHGVKAAKLAGMRCVAVTSSTTAERLSEADQVLEKVADFDLG